MNLASVPQILNQSIYSFYIRLDGEFTVKAIEDNSTNLTASAPFEVGKPFLDSFNKKYCENFTTAIKAVQQGEENTPVLAPIEINGSELIVKWTINSIRKDDNAIKGFELLGVQLKEDDVRKPTDTQAGELKTNLFDPDSQPYFSYDFNGNILNSNLYFAQLLQYEQAELFNRSFFSLVPSSDVTSIKENIGNASAGMSCHFICTLLNKNNEKVVVNIINTPLIQNNLFVGVNGYVKEMAEKTVKSKSFFADDKRLILILSRLKKILSSSQDMICAFDENGKFTYVSAACKEILGYKSRELIGKNYVDFVYREDLERSIEATESIKKGQGTTNFENRFYRKDGSVANLVWSSRWEENDKRFYATARDATEKKLSEANLKASEENYKTLFYHHSVPSWIYEIDTLKLLEVNDAAVEHYGYSRDEFLQLELKNLLVESELKRHEEFRKQKDFYSKKHKGLWIHKKKNGEIFHAEISSNTIDYQGKRARLVLSIDRTEQIMTEQELRKSNERFVFLSNATFDALWDWDLLTDKVSWSEGLYKMFDIPDNENPTRIDWWFSHLHAEDKQRVEKKLKYHLQNNAPRWEDEYRMKVGSNYTYIYDRGYVIYDEQHRPVRMIGAMQDLTERKSHENMLQNLNNSLEKRARELAESNGELERFAYVASHDLQEPLRMVTSFLQLLEKRYKDKLDNKAHEYITYAVDGAERMKQLILDLLEYSRVNSSKAEVEEVDVNEIIESMQLTYKTFLIQTKGTINYTTLPVVKGNKTQILQLFQNVIGNAIKYRSNVPPVINVSYEEEKAFYKFVISDNGIGIDSKFFNKIFIIFQRLHNREEYSGTGIGLAICKKIIDKHGGRIWVDSNPGKGSTFYFTLPKSK